MRELILVRHAKSDWPTGVEDKERTLSDRGVRDCQIAARYFIGLEELNHFVVHVSSAARTVQTWQEVSKPFSEQPQVVKTDEIYETSFDGLISYLADQSAQKLIFVGHNPSLALLGEHLTGEAIGKFPSLSIWHLQVPNEWERGAAITVNRFVSRADPNLTDSD
jgi:phosphohistidine phosphatase